MVSACRLWRSLWQSLCKSCSYVLFLHVLITKIADKLYPSCCRNGREYTLLLSPKLFYYLSHSWYFGISWRCYVLDTPPFCEFIFRRYLGDLYYSDIFARSIPIYLFMLITIISGSSSIWPDVMSHHMNITDYSMDLHCIGIYIILIILGFGALSIISSPEGSFIYGVYALRNIVLNLNTWIRHLISRSLEHQCFELCLKKHHFIVIDRWTYTIICGFAT